MRVGILGVLQVEDAAGRPVEVGGARLRALLARLAAAAGHPVSVAALVEALWGDSPPADQLNALQSLVSRLRRTLPDPAVVESGPAGYSLALPAEAVDAGLFDRLARAGHAALATADAQEAARLLRDGLDLWRGPVLADAEGQPWATAAAARLDEQRLAATEDLIEAELVLGRHAEVLAETEALAARHPLRERLQGLLIRALYAAGRQADALAAYENVRRRLADELGVDPSPALAELHLRVLRADPQLTGAPARTPRTNLPAQLTSFVGRDAELALLADQLSRHRLVTLVGPGGAGKTRLAVEAASGAVGRFPEGVWLAELAPVTGADGVPQAVLGSVGLPKPRLREDGAPRETEASSRRDAVSLLVETLRDGRALLVLDNCEHLVEAAASTAGELLARCPGLRVLATSREPLGITGEVLAPVAPLGLPPVGPATPTASEALEHPAVRLFADRAAAVRPGFSVDDETVGPAVEVCRRLDGLPLAIELAAARMRSLPVEEVAARLDDRFRLLTGGSRTALPRHQTLRAVVAWSWELLSEPERRLADRLAVFPGGATAQSASRVCAGPDLPAEDVPDLLAALVDRSLLQPVAGREPREPRYRMLETLREYGLEQLASAGAVAATRRAHAAYFLALAEKAEPHLRRPEQVDWIARLTAERDNLLAALRFAVDTGDADTAVRMGAALAWYWTLLSSHAEAATWLTTVADLPGDAPPEARAVCLVMGAMSGAAAWHDFATLRARMDQAKALAADSWTEHPMLGLVEPVAAMLGGDQHALDLLAGRPEPSDQWARATQHFLTAMLLENEGRFEDHRDSLKRALEGYREVGERWGLANALTALGSVLLAEGDLDGSLAAYAEARGLMAEIMAQDDASFARTRLAAVHARAGDLDRARAELVAAREEVERSGSELGLVVTDLALADLARQSGDRSEARRLAESGLHRNEAIPGGPPQVRAMVLAMLAVLDADDGEVERARARVAEAAEFPGANRDMPVMGQLALAAAYVALLDGDLGLAARTFGAALALRGTEERTDPQVVLLRRRLTEALGPEELDRLYSEGAALPRTQALALLRGNAAPASRQDSRPDQPGGQALRR